MLLLEPYTIWKCTVPGIDGTVMEGGLFSFHLKFRAEYPAEPPKIYSLDKKQKTAFEFFQDATKRELESADIDPEYWTPVMSGGLSQMKQRRRTWSCSVGWKRSRRRRSSSFEMRRSGS